ncbi:MAG: lysine--tRNA ligase [Nitrospirae bacterium]|nr:MAG: lysine--tRNA ligase [Nitrospirota bacterium]
MEELNEIIKQRLKKVEELRQSGLEPYGGAFKERISTSEIFQKFSNMSEEELADVDDEYRLAGRIIAFRRFGKAAFAHIKDNTGKLQIYFKKDILGDDYNLVRKLDIGDIVGVEGRPFRTKTGELTIEVKGIMLLTKSLRPLPEKWHGLRDIELRYRQRYVDLIVNPGVKEVFYKRSKLIRCMREFFDKRGFVEVETPMMHLVAGGAAAKPFKTHHNALDIDLYLRIAPELYLKRLLVGGYEKVYELNRNFRNEGISTKHNPEFTMIEFYIAYEDYKYLMDLTEELITQLCMELNGTLKIPYGEYNLDLTPPWPRYTMFEAMERAGIDMKIIGDVERAKAWAEEHNIKILADAPYGKILDEIFKHMVEPELINPTFITDYPVEISPLAKRKKDDPSLVERFELFIASRELANAFSELNDPIDQHQRFLRQIEAGEEGTDKIDEDFIRALQYGMPPAAGEGIGIDRLTMVLTNSQSIRDVILFPLLKPES